MNGLKEKLSEYNDQQVDNYISYLKGVEEATNKDKTLKNKWMKFRTLDDLADAFRCVVAEGLVFDGVHITLQSTGVSYDFQAYKNKMLLAYPESLIDIQLVYKDDVFSFSKESGKVIYSHIISNPFSHKDADIIGGYCVIKNKRGDFLTTLSKEEIEKHRKIARTDMFWQRWYAEMCNKTVVKKACKAHFGDIYEKIFAQDNQEIDLSLPLNVEVSAKAEIEKIETLENLVAYYHENKAKHIDDKIGFNDLLAKRKVEITKKAEDENK